MDIDDLRTLREQLQQVMATARLIAGPPGSDDHEPNYAHLAASCMRAIIYVDEDIENAPRKR